MYKIFLQKISVKTAAIHLIFITVLSFVADINGLII